MSDQLKMALTAVTCAGMLAKDMLRLAKNDNDERDKISSHLLLQMGFVENAKSILLNLTRRIVPGTVDPEPMLDLDEMQRAIDEEKTK